MVPSDFAVVLNRLNRASIFTIAVGGGFFFAGSALAIFTRVSATACTVVYLVGGALFTLGSAGFLLVVINTDRSSQNQRWQWWRYEPHRPDWVSAVVLLFGTVVFGVDLLDSLFKGLNAIQTDRMIWTPDVIGCLLFLVSGHITLAVLRRDKSPSLFRRRIWWVAVFNQAGSVLFMISALSAFVKPLTDSPVNVSMTNWGTMTGAGCFVIASVIQALEHNDSVKHRDS